MDQTALIRLLEKAAVSEELQRDLFALAAKHGIDFLDQPLSDEALEKVVGGVSEGDKDPDAAKSDRQLRLKEALQGFLAISHEIKLTADKYPT